jgi:predicted O-methyltransferase YrrM
MPLRGPFSRYLGAQETALLAALIGSVKPRVMIEFGCNRGTTAKRLLDNIGSLEKYIGIDVAPDHVPTLACQRSEVPNHAGCDAADDARFLLLTMPSRSLDVEALEPCDAVFIDGDHSLPAVMHESRLARALLRPGGIICWHDYGNPAVEVTAALDALQAQGWPINCVENSWLAFLRV